jgi:hypothetical protein
LTIRCRLTAFFARLANTAVQASGGTRAITTHLPLIVILLLAGFLRLHHAATDPPVNDETFTWRIISRDWGEIWAPIVSDSHPPLHYVLLKLWTSVVGTSLIGMRSLSAVCGLASVAIVYFLVRESGRCFPARGAQTVAGERYFHCFAGPIGAATLAAILTACHDVQVLAGRIARMYGLGVMLCALLSLVLIKALQGGRGRDAWWVAYGIVAACCMYTHYYLLFSILAHVMFLGLEACARLKFRLRAADGSTQGAGMINAGKAGEDGPCANLHRMAWSLTLATVLYLPWLPLLFRQASSVHASFWIPSINLHDLAVAYWCWCTGAQFAGYAATWLFVAAAIALVGLSIVRGHGGLRLFVLQALVPWAGCLAVWYLDDTTLLQARYFMFAHVGMLSAVAVAATGIPGAPERTILATALVVSCAAVSVVNAFHCTSTGSCTARAAEVFATQCLPGDMVITGGAPELNRFMYFARQRHATLAQEEIRWRAMVARYGPGAWDHSNSLKKGEAMSDTVDLGGEVQRVWLVGYAERNVPIEELRADRWKTEGKWQFTGVGSRAEGGRKERLDLRLMVRDGKHGIMH